tara:strand:+ start:566 stop:754 length:189 start_codon:yes stop_codon:yes gene_type:complete
MRKPKSIKNYLWKERRIGAINRKIKKGVAQGWSAQNIAEGYIEEYDRICNSDANSKREYKTA